MYPKQFPLLIIEVALHVGAGLCKIVFRLKDVVAEILPCWTLDPVYELKFDKY